MPSVQALTRIGEWRDQPPQEKCRTRTSLPNIRVQQNRHGASVLKY